jgi:hypothetical protein
LKCVILEHYGFSEKALPDIALPVKIVWFLEKWFPNLIF